MHKYRWSATIAFGLLGILLLNACGDTTATNAPAAAATPDNTTAAMTTTMANTSAAAMNTTAAVTTAASTTAAATTQAATDKKLSEIAASLPKLRPAPEWDNQNWLNSAPIKLADLKGKVVLVEFWTFECINCIHVLPSVKQWYAQFHPQGLQVVTFHDPEFSTERDWNNVQQAVKDDGIEYPVAQDNDFKTWGNFGVNAWPTWFLVDKQGIIRYKHIGEGAYDETALNIQALLAES